MKNIKLIYLGKVPIGIPSLKRSKEGNPVMPNEVIHVPEKYAWRLLDDPNFDYVYVDMRYKGKDVLSIPEIRKEPVKQNEIVSIPYSFHKDYEKLGFEINFQETVTLEYKGKEPIKITQRRKLVAPGEVIEVLDSDSDELLRKGFKVFKEKETKKGGDE